jgi:hypothetical protein
VSGVVVSDVLVALPLSPRTYRSIKDCLRERHHSGGGGGPTSAHCNPQVMSDLACDQPLVSLIVGALISDPRFWVLFPQFSALSPNWTGIGWLRCLNDR